MTGRVKSPIRGMCVCLLDMQAVKSYIVGMKKARQCQYTIRSVPAEVDRVLRRRARAAGKSLNSVVLEILSSQADHAPGPRLYHDLDHLAGTWVEDPEFDRIIEEQRQIDPELWQ